MEREHEIDAEEIARQEAAEKARHESLADLHADADLNELISGKKPVSAVGPEQQEIHKSPETIPEKEPGSGIRPTRDQPDDVQIMGDAQDIQKLDTALETLEGSERGKAIAESIRDRGVQMQFGALPETTVAQFNSSTNKITINETYKDASPSFLAANLAHEGIHLQMGQPLSANDALEQEYQCFKGEAEVWNQIKGNENNVMEEDIVAMIARGESAAKAQIWQIYGEEYFARWQRT